MDILVVDDNIDAAEMLQEILQKATGLEVECVHDGEAAMLHLDDAVRLPRVILLDLLMEPMSGWAVLECLRASRRLRGIPVVVMTGADLPPNRLLPVVAFLRKPMDPDVLLATVSRVLGHGRESA